MSKDLVLLVGDITKMLSTFPHQDYLPVFARRAQWHATARVLKAHGHLIACMKQLVKPQVPALTKEKAKRQIKRLEGI